MTRAEDPACAQAVSGWALTVGAYRFFVHAEEIVGQQTGLEVCALHHAPPWMVGVALVDSQVLGIIDLGRFLGLARIRPGPCLIPSAPVGLGWALQAHSAEPVLGAVPIADDPVDGADDFPGATTLAGGGMVAFDNAPAALARRRPPGFAGGRVQWAGPDGNRVMADVLRLNELPRHPRIRELQS